MFCFRNCFVVPLILSSMVFGQEATQQFDPPDVDSIKNTHRRPDAGSPKTSSKNFHLSPQPKRENYEAGFLPLGTDPENRLGWPFLKHMAEDQKQFWMSPEELAHGGATTFAPFAAFTGALIASDSWISRQVPDKPNQLNRSLNISNYSVYSLIGAGGGAFLWGHFTNNDHLRETGLLAGEAAINSTGVNYLFKEITQRPRPQVANGNGTFFQGGNSFASEHSALAWSIASVVAHEYPGPLSKLAAYGLASAVTLTRVTSKQHFASDAVVGSALGWYFGRQIYRAHHDTQLAGAAWGNFFEEKQEVARNPEKMGSPYVPVDDWIYPLFERLAALGYIQTAYMGMRPWTRMECARLLEEADERMRYDDLENGDAQKIYEALSKELGDEIARLNGAPNLGVSLDSLYARFTNISGRPLRDGYHFGQTLVDDFGRPYGEGSNAISGLSAHAVAGPFSFYVRGEYQHAPESPSYPFAAQQAIANADLTLPVPNGTQSLSRFDLLEGSVALTLHNTQISFGKQSLWLGPGEAGSLLLSDNAEPMVMLRIDSVSPYHIPLVSKIFGPVHTQFFLGQLAGHQFEVNGTTLLGPGNINPQPYLHGYKISFKPTANLEFGMGITAQFVGPGLPFTWRNFLRTFYVHNQTGLTASNANPGKRLSAFDFTYKVPGLRKWLTFYNEALVVDEVSPIGSTRPTLNPGIYLPHLPKLPNMELRAEGLHESLTDEFAPGYVYYGLRRYRSGYTNNGQMLGSWIGRAGRGGQGWLTYWLSPRSKIQLGYRQQMVSKDFIGGGRLSDYSVRGETMLGRNVGLSGFMQYEHWWFPVLSGTTQSDVTASFQVTFHPHWQLRK
jgi:membrane-associated phospholipid phosphatase